MQQRLWCWITISMSLVCMCLSFSRSAVAHVQSGGNCAGCHAAQDPTTDPRISVSANTGLLSVSPRLDGGSTSALKVFTVQQGQTVRLTLSVTDGGLNGDPYAFALTGTVKSSGLESLVSGVPAGVKTSLSDLLTFTPGSTGWTSRTSSSRTYFTESGSTITNSSYSWNGTTNLTKNYDFVVNANAPVDVYSLTLRAAGVDSNIGMWTQSEEVLLNVVSAVPEPGTLASLAAACGGLTWVVWRRRRNRSRD